MAAVREVNLRVLTWPGADGIIDVTLEKDVKAALLSRSPDGSLPSVVFEASGNINVRCPT